MSEDRKEEPKKESHWNEIKLALMILLIVAVPVTIGVLIKYTSAPRVQTETSNGFTFTRQNGFWHTDIRNPLLGQVYTVEFRYAPSEVRNIPVSGDPKQFFKILNLNNLTGAYLTFDPNSNLSAVPLVAADISHFLNSLNGVTIVAACTVNETSACEDRPIVTCDSVNESAMVIYIKDSETPSVSLDKNCLTISGQGESLLKANTRLLFSWYGIL